MKKCNFELIETTNLKRNVWQNKSFKEILYSDARLKTSRTAKTRKLQDEMRNIRLFRGAQIKWEQKTAE